MEELKYHRKSSKIKSGELLRRMMLSGLKSLTSLVLFYTFFPNGQSQESRFFLMFWRNVYNPTLENLLQPKLRYAAGASALFLLEMLREAYMLASVNLKRAKNRQTNKMTRKITNFKVGDFWLLMSHNKQSQWNAKYVSNFQICKIINDWAYYLQDPSGHICCALVLGIQLYLPAEFIASLLPDEKAFERVHKCIYDPSLMPDLHWSNPN